MPTQLITKALRVARQRPMEFYRNLRTYLLFSLTHLLSTLFLPTGIRLGRNVRLQKLRCLSAEKPNASIQVGSHSVIYEFADIAAYGNGKIEIGQNSIIGDVRIYSRQKISIGDRAIFSWNVFIQDFQPHPISPDERAKQLISMTEYFRPRFDGASPQAPAFDTNFPTDPIELGHDIWFGANSTILPGVKIGSGSIVAAGAVVVRGSYPERCILAGNPARIVKEIP